MRNGTFLVHAEANLAGVGRIDIARDLARRFSGRVAGFTASLAAPDGCGDPAMADWNAPSVRDRTDTVNEMIEAETRFRAAIPLAEIAFFDRRRMAPIASLLHLAGAADLAVVSANESKTAGPFPGETLSPGDAILAAGIPVLTVPDGVGALHARHIVVGWTQARETRRAVHDALPFLEAADSVLLLAVITSDDRYSQTEQDIERTATWLRHHGVAKVECTIRLARDEQVADKLARWAQELDADLIVAGGYGHSRSREFLLGGTTRALLERSPVCCLFSH